MHLLDYVNIKQGTASTSRFSHGNTLPLTQLPFGMAAFAPQTNWNPNFYHPADRSLEGVRLTHQPSPWVGDFGCFLMIPQSGDPFSRQHAIWSGYRPSDAVLTPVYQKLRFLRARADFELTPAQRGAFIRLSFDSSVQIPRLTLRPMDAYTKLALNPETRRLEGYTTYHRHPAADSFALYFVMEFDGDLDLENTAATFNDGRVAPGQGNEGDGAGLSIAFASREIQIRLAVSYISIAQAAENLKQELEGCSFEEIHSKGAAEWETWLSKIRVLETDEADLKTFYTCMYRLFLFPNKMHEISATGETIHYSPYDGKIHPGVLYTNNGFWDTFRTVYPLYSILCPGMYEEILEGFVNAYRESGWLPKWPSPAETGIMPGTLIDAIIADAAVKGIGSRELLETALEGALKHSVTPGEKSQVGRRGVEEYVKLGYVPKDQYRENVNRSLDYIYGDFCIAQTAKVLGKDAIAAEYMEKSKNYRLLYDAESGFMRGRRADGSFQDPFDPFEWGGDYTEGSAWQNSLAVYHDIEGLIQLMGGRDAFLDHLDRLFATPPLYTVGSYGMEIHEMTEMAAVDFGQCAISNQPSFHIPYLYIAAGRRDKAVYWLEKMTRELFSCEPEGFPGDEDNGSMAGWYLFAMLGLYPICPGKAQYIVSRPLLPRAELQIGDKTLTIARGENGEFLLGGREITMDYISHEELIAAAV